MAVWDDSVEMKSDPPTWLLTGHMLLWNDGSPAHIDMEPFKPAPDGWEAALMVSRRRWGNTAKEIRMLIQLKKLLKDEEGATAVEYGMMVAAIAAVIVITVFALGGKVSAAFNKVNDNWK